MSFSPEEMQIIEWSKQNGKSVQEMKDAIFRFRTTGSPVDPSKPIQPATRVGGGFIETIKDIPSDLGEAFRGSVEAVSRGIETADTARAQVEALEISPVAGTAKT